MSRYPALLAAARRVWRRMFQSTPDERQRLPMIRELTEVCRGLRVYAEHRPRCPKLDNPNRDCTCGLNSLLLKVP